MVARVSFVRSIRDVLHYHDKKVEASTAKLLFASGFASEAKQLSAKNILEIFRKLTDQNVRSRCNVLHASLNFLTEDQLTPGKMIQIAGDYMKGIGFEKQPYLVYQHFDAGHPHLHLASVIIQDGGKRIPTHNLAYETSAAAAREVGQLYALHPTDSLSRQHIELETVPLHRIRYGELPTWRGMSSIVDQVIKSYNSASLAQLNAVLNQFGIMADGGRPGSRLDANEGLIYYLLDEKRHRVGRAIKASAMHGAPTRKRLQRRFALNEMSRGSYQKRLQYHLDKALHASQSGQQAMEALLQKQGIRIVFSQNPEGKIFGATFIDNGARTVFNDWELGEKYHYEIFLRQVRLSQAAYGVMPYRAAFSKTEAQANALQLKPSDQKGEGVEVSEARGAFQNSVYPGSELPVLEIARDQLYYDNDAYRQHYFLSPELKRTESLKLGR